MTRRSGRLWLVAAGAAGAVAVVALLDRDPTGGPQIVFREPVAVEIPVSGGSNLQRQKLREILSRIGPIGLTAVEIRAAGKSWRPFPSGAVELRAATRGRDDVRGAWEANLLAGALQEQLLEAKLPPVVALMTNGGGGRLIGATWPPSGKHRRLTRRGAEDVARRLGAAADRGGANGTTIAILRPHGFAFAVRFRTRHPGRFLVDRSTELLRLGGPLGASSGTYLEVRDDGDRFAAAISIANTRGVVSEGWRARPDLAGCLGRSASSIHPPPPCPKD